MVNIYSQDQQMKTKKQYVFCFKIEYILNG